MSVITTIVGKQAKKEIEELKKSLKQIQAQILSISKAPINFSSIANLQEIDKLNKQIQALQNQINGLNAQIEKYTRIKAKANQKTSEEIVNQRQLAKNADTQARAVSKLAGAYQNLTAKLAIAERNYRNLAASLGVHNRQTKKAQEEVLRLRKALDAIDAPIGRTSHRVGSYSRTMFQAFRNLAAVFGVFSAIDIFRDIFRLAKELQALNLALQAATKTQDAFTRSQEFLKQLAEETGLEINTLTSAYLKFFASAEGKIKESQIQQIFQDISKAAGILGLSVEQQEGTFRALEQMMSKGNIQAEELRGQLAERLPGAFKIMAQSMGVTEMELNKLLKDGKVLAADVLPKFAAEFAKAVGADKADKIRTLAAESNRLSNAWTRFIENITNSEGIIGKSLSNMLQTLTYIIDAMTWLNKSLDEVQKDGFESERQKAYEQTLKDIADTAKKTGKTIKEVAQEEYSTALEMYNLQKSIVDQRNQEIDQIKKQADAIEGMTAEKEILLLRIREMRESLGFEISMLGATKGGLDAYKESLIEVIKQETKAVDVKRQKIKAIELESRGVHSLVKEIRDQISVLEEVEKLYTKNSREALYLASSIDFLKKALELDIDNSKGRKDFEDFSRVTKESQERLRALRGELSLFFDGFTNQIFQDTGLNTVQTLFDGTFDRLLLGAQNTQERFAVYFNTISEIAQETFNFLNQISTGYFDREFERLERQKNIQIKFAGESTVARERIEEQYEEKRRELQRKQAQSQKTAAIFNSIVNTAQAVVAALANPPGPPATIPISITVGAIGAAQTALIAAQKIPAFKDGVRGFAGGLAFVGDGGVSEFIRTEKGVFKTPNTPTLVDLPSGSDVFKNENEFQKELNIMLQKTGIQPIDQINQFNGIQAHEFDAIMGKHFSNMKLQQVIMDGNGFSSHLIGKNSRTKRIESIVTGKGLAF